ncbi:hypothetical protein HC000_17875 [Pseudoalteromonas sp. MIP2626]|uniref:hypothetical protein n=1 Tax=Pseudoalteromonas sp. MIP2626 TaxID=2705464 RepID=UPI0015C94B13|nr:hypothetical protein [Pseudoalteromonas sp. MIP2626]NYR14287.1 hypothetical protein [Pseudoalteromonas sp. MIP2626]
MSRDEYQHKIQRSTLSNVGEIAYFQGFIDDYDRRFYDNPRGYSEYVRYRLPLAYGLGVTLEQVFEMRFSNIKVKEILEKILKNVSYNNIYSNEDWFQ